MFGQLSVTPSYNLAYRIPHGSYHYIAWMLNNTALDTEDTYLYFSRANGNCSSEGFWAISERLL
jgi:hypothetical protein